MKTLDQIGVAFGDLITPVTLHGRSRRIDGHTQQRGGLRGGFRHSRRVMTYPVRLPVRGGGSHTYALEPRSLVGQIRSVCCQPGALVRQTLPLLAYLGRKAQQAPVPGGRVFAQCLEHGTGLQPIGRVVGYPTPGTCFTTTDRLQHLAEREVRGVPQSRTIGRGEADEPQRLPRRVDQERRRRTTADQGTTIGTGTMAKHRKARRTGAAAGNFAQFCVEIRKPSRNLAAIRTGGPYFGPRRRQCSCKTVRFCNLPNSKYHPPPHPRVVVRDTRQETTGLGRTVQGQQCRRQADSCPIVAEGRRGHAEQRDLSPSIQVAARRRRPRLCQEFVGHHRKR